MPASHSSRGICPASSHAATCGVISFSTNARIERRSISCSAVKSGCGIVYAGQHVIVGAPVAIKCLKPVSGDRTAEARMTEAFLREAKLLFALTHPGMSTVLVGTSELAHLEAAIAAVERGPLPPAALELLNGLWGTLAKPAQR